MECLKKIPLKSRRDPTAITARGQAEKSVKQKPVISAVAFASVFPSVAFRRHPERAKQQGISPHPPIPTTALAITPPFRGSELQLKLRHKNHRAPAPPLPVTLPRVFVSHQLSQRRHPRIIPVIPHIPSKLERPCSRLQLLLQSKSATAPL